MNQTCGSRRFFSLAFVVLCLTIIAIIILLLCPFPLGELKSHRTNPPSALLHDRDDDHSTEATNTVFVHTGRWEFLRIQLPYLYRDLRKNGGVIDKVQFMMVQYEPNTLDRLINFTNIANNILMEEVFSIHYMGYIPYSPPSNAAYGYHQALYEVNQELIKKPTKRFFKLDDDVVYIHPEAFKYMIDMRRPDCGIHYFNTAGSNWRCSWLHQKYGVFNGLNPKNLTFNFNPHAKCGWKSTECANLTLQTFLHLYRHSQLKKYFFDVEHLEDRERFSINGYLFDNNTNPLELKKIMLQRGLCDENEERMLQKYFLHTQYPPCIVGKALIVHFAYHTVVQDLLKIGLLEKFHDLVMESKDSFHMPLELWSTLEKRSRVMIAIETI